MRSKFKYLLSNTFIFAIGGFLTKFMLFLLMPLYTTKLTTEQYGIAELLNNLIEVILPIATLCIIDAVFRLSIDDNADYTGLLSTTISILLKSYVVLFLLSSAFYYVNGYEYTFYFYFLYVASTVQKLFSQFARGIGHIGRFAVSGVINTLALLVMNIIFLLYFNAGIEGYLISLIVSYLIAGIFSFVASKAYLYIDRKAVNKTLLKNMLAFSAPNIPKMLSLWVNNVSSRYIILGFCGVGTAGMFAAACKLPAMINLLSAIFQQAWQYSSSKEIQNKDSGSFFTDVFKYYSSSIIIACSILIMIAPYLAKLVLKGEFYDAWVYVPLLLMSATIGCVSTFFETFYLAAKNNIMAMISIGIGAGINILINLISIPFFGVYGALAASVVSYLVITIIQIINTRKYVVVKINYPLIVIQFIIIFVQATVLTIGDPFAKLFSIICFVVILIVNVHFIKDVFQVVHNIILKYISLIKKGVKTERKR